MLEEMLASILEVWLKISPYILNLIFAAISLVIGIIIAKLVQYIIINGLKSVNSDDFFKKNNSTRFLEKAEIKRSPSELLGDFSYWVIVLVLIISISNYLGLNVNPLLDRIISYIGIVFLAALVLSLGVFLSSFISSVIYLITVNVGIPGSKTIARLMQYATIIFAFLVALEQLGIGPELIVPSIGVIIGAVGLALAIAFGLGCKDIMADFVSNLIRGK